jgi:succinoglycan biosynthesis protein ExoU
MVAAWNRESTIQKAISSALADPAVRRVFVIDNGSEDNTVERAMACDDGSGRVVIRELNTKRGPSAARNVALDLSDAPWVTVLDADDFLLPSRFSKLLAWSVDADLIADDILQVAEDRVETEAPKPLLSAEPFTPWVCDFTAFVRGNISQPGKLRKELGFLKPIMRRAFLDRHNLRYDEEMRLGEDFALYARALAFGARFLVVPAQGYVSLTRPDSLSARHSQEDLERLRDSDRDLAKVRAFSPAEMAAIEKHFRSIDARVQWLRVIEAVKRRRLSPLLAAFFRSWDVSVFVAARLWEQLVLRSAKRLRLQH